MSPQTLVWVRVLYAGSLLGLLAFFLLWEDGQPRQAFGTARARWRHVGRNLGLFVWVVLGADYLAGQWLVSSQSLLLRSTDWGLNLAQHLPLAVQCGLAWLASDLLDYGVHRLSHRVGLLWRFHAVHHSDSQLDVSSGLRTHPVDTAVHVLATLGLYAVLGLPLWIEGLRAIVCNALSLVQHANVRFPDWVEKLSPVLVTPAQHRDHHDAEADGRACHFGLCLSIWDHLLGSTRQPSAEGPARIGLDSQRDERWQSVWGMLRAPFQRMPEA